MNWELGFKRVRWAFITVSCVIFVAIHWNASAAAIGEDAVYALFFVGGCVLAARGCIWVVRGFITPKERAEQ